MPIRDVTRERVLAAAADLGYKPNLLARGLRGSRSSLIGVIARDVSDPFHIQVLQGINEVTRAREFRLFLGHVDYRPDVALTYGSMFERSHADGIIVLGDLIDGERTLADLATQHRYVVGVSSQGADSMHAGYDLIATAKSTLETLCRYLHYRLSPEGTSVNVVRTRFVDTESLVDTFGPDFPKFVRQFEPDVLTPPADVADAIVGISSGLMDALGGQVLTVDRGAGLYENFSRLYQERNVRPIVTRRQP